MSEYAGTLDKQVKWRYLEKISVVGVDPKSGRDKVVFHSVPAIITNQGGEFEELTRERRNIWISAIDRVDLKAASLDL